MDAKRKKFAAFRVGELINLRLTRWPDTDRAEAGARPLGIIEHKFSAEETSKANTTVQRAVENW
ncbi:hypothetical protein DVH24_027207 [Malus domestica]|uniref:Uncharacterized protein n=1 Tax=Malus domestica TaxID=3750 RepID=A0A498IL77_MALDO|nr:hypothetical protein DVH24_027207 [Malus domestica]